MRGNFNLLLGSAERIERTFIGLAAVAELIHVVTRAKMDSAISS